MGEGKGARVRTTVQTPTFTTGNNFKDESAELFCQALSVRHEGVGATSLVGDGPGRWGGSGGGLWAERSEVTGRFREPVSVWTLPILTKATAEAGLFGWD